MRRAKSSERLDVCEDNRLDKSERKLLLHKGFNYRGKLGNNTTHTHTKETYCNVMYQDILVRKNRDSGYYRGLARQESARPYLNRARPLSLQRGVARSPTRSRRSESTHRRVRRAVVPATRQGNMVASVNFHVRSPLGSIRSNRL